MKIEPLVISLVLFAAGAAFASDTAATVTQENEFHDPFATDNAATGPQVQVSDPLERVNRSVFHFNEKLYRWILKPTAKGYRTVAPKPARESIGRFFDNAKYPVRLVNNLLEGRVKGAGIETGRFVVNTTVGVGGFFDPATHWKLAKQPADLDQTLAIYGIPTGVYLNWPVLGPSSVRGTVGVAGDFALSPTLYLDVPWGVTAGAGALNIVNNTSLHIEEYDGLMSATLDPYVALRSAYFESRENALKK